MVRLDKEGVAWKTGWEFVKRVCKEGVTWKIGWDLVKRVWLGRQCVAW